VNYSNALDSLTPNAGWSWDGKTYEGISWHPDNTDDLPTKAELDAEVTRLQTEYDNNAYQRNRAAEYPSIPDQLDDIYHNGIDAWKATIKVTKDKYPKP
jgi:hypothetical protein|tara:strand:- start:232 stop:528 length:297 start_codon:yes stop_codon:yes gene_type:complete